LVSTSDVTNEEIRDSEAPERELRRLTAAARRASRRLRAGMALAAALKLVPLALLGTVVALAVAKVRPSGASDRWVLGIAVLGAALVLGAIVRSLARPRPPLAGAIELDRHHGLTGRVANALSFRAVPRGERTPLMELAIRDGAEVAAQLDPRRAVPIPVPEETWLAAVLLVGLVGVAVLEVPTVRHLPPPPAPKPLLLGADDLELFKNLGGELARESKSPEQLAAVGRYNKLVEDIAEHRVDRHEVFRRLAEIERDLAQGLAEERDALDEGLEAVARELGRSPMTRKASEALSEKNLEDAEKALRELADKLKKGAPKPGAGELDRLRQALTRASEQSRERVQAIEKRRRELTEERESLLKKKREAGDAGTDPKLDKKLEENQRKLEHLERESSRARRGQEQLSELAY